MWPMFCKHYSRKNYISLVYAGYGYHNLRLNEQSSYLTTFSSHVGRCRFKQLPFGATPSVDIYQRKTEEIFKELLNKFGIADTVGYDSNGRDHDKTLRKSTTNMQKEESKIE